MATATISESKKVESQRDRNLPVPPRALRIAARAFLRLTRADVVWLAVRESRSQVAVVRCSEGARSTAGLGLAIEPGVGVGGAVLAKSEPWWGKIGDHGATRLSDRESTVLCHEGVRHLMAIPLLTTGFWGKARIEGVAYVGTRLLPGPRPGEGSVDQPPGLCRMHPTSLRAQLTVRRHNPAFGSRAPRSCAPIS